MWRASINLTRVQIIQIIKRISLRVSLQKWEKYDLSGNIECKYMYVTKIYKMHILWHTYINTTQHTPEDDYAVTESVGSFTTGVVLIGAVPRRGLLSRRQPVGPRGFVRISDTMLKVSRWRMSTSSYFHASSRTLYRINICFERSEHPRWPVIVLINGSLSI